MKLIFAVVNNDDSHNVSTALTKGGYSATKLSSTGGFLMSGNTTFLICTDEGRVDDVIAIITKYSRKRRQYMPVSNVSAVEMQTASFPVEVSVGGATVFVTDIERFEKV